MTHPSERSPARLEVPLAVPVGARVAAALFLVFGIAAVINAASAQTDAGWVGNRLLPRALFRLLASAVIAWGIARGARWAWWLGIVAGVIWFLMNVAVFVVLDRGDLHWLRPSSSQLFPAVALVSLGFALALLFGRDVRAAFRDPQD